MFNKVKLLKLIMLTILMFIVSIIPKELYQGYMNQYNDFYETTFYLPEGMNKEEMLNELNKTANKHNIYIFKICEEDINIYTTTIDVYANEKMLDILSREYEIEKGRHGSLFSGETNINCYDLFDISDELIESDVKYYLYGDKQAMINFKEDLVDVYAGSFPKEDGFNDLESYTMLLVVAWIFVIIVLLLVTVYDAISQKKENFLRFTMGEHIWIVYVKNILSDTVYLIFLYEVLKLIISRTLGNIVFERYSDIMFLIMLILNAIFFVAVSKIDYKTGTADMTSDSGVLKYNYIISAICMIILLVSVTSCVELIDISLQYKKQEEYFRTHKDYNWYQKIRVENKELNLQKYLNEFISKNEKDFLYLCEGSEIIEGSKEVFYEASLGSKKYLQSKIKELNRELNSQIYILINKDNNISKKELEYIVDWTDASEYEVIYYTESIDIVYRIFEAEPITEMVHNPVIIFYNEDNIDESTEGSVYEFYLGMVDGSEDKWESFANARNITYVETNAWDYYCHRWESLLRTIIINIVIIAMMMFIYLLVSCMIINMEFKVNAKALIIKKIYGWNIFERFGKLYGSTAIISGTAIILITFLNLFVIDVNLKYMYVAVLLILCIQYVFITCQIILYEKKDMQAILKGCNI